MEYKEIKKIIDDMEESNLSLLDIEFPDGTKVKMEKKIEADAAFSNVAKNCTNQISNVIENTENTKTEKVEEKGNSVKSPMVGTFYLKPSPTSAPYVEVGSKVKKGTILCIIEAMKLMNEIESEYDGEIAEILVKDGETVEYGKPLFRIV